MLLPQDQGSGVPLSPTPSGEPTTSPENAPPDSCAVAEGPANMTSLSKYNSRCESHMPTTSEKQFKCKTKALPSKSLCGFSVNVHHMSAVYRGGPCSQDHTCGGHASLTRESWGALTWRGPGSCTSCPAGQSRRGGEPLSPRLRGPRSRLGRGHLQPVITFPELEDSARIRTDVQTRRLCDVPLVLGHRLLYTHLHIHTRLHIHTHACAYTHTPRPRCGPEDDRLSSKLFGFVWKFMVGQRAGDWGRDT